MKYRFMPVVAVLLTAGLAVMMGATAAGASPADLLCGDREPAQLLVTQTGTAAAADSPALVAYLTQYKAQNDPEADAVRAVAASYANHDAEKVAMMAAGKIAPRGSVTKLSTPAQVRACAEGSQTTALEPDASGSGYAWIDNLVQQGQWNGYYCGPATVSEMAWTVPGPSNVDQGTAGSWMGTNSDGTGVDQETNGLNHFVGVPDFGWNFYGFVWMDGYPTASQRASFLSRLQYDVGVTSPVAGDAYEVVGGPHLIGHPNQNIFHWFEIGGWNTNTSQVYYADSATSVWSSVPARSWQDTYTVETILGGRGYIW